MHSLIRRSSPAFKQARKVCTASLKAMADFYDELFTAPDTLKYYVKGEWKESKSGKTVSFASDSCYEVLVRLPWLWRLQTLIVAASVIEGNRNCKHLMITQQKLLRQQYVCRCPTGTPRQMKLRTKCKARATLLC